MKKIAILLAAALLVAAFIPGAASAGKAKKQTVEGSVALALPFFNDLSKCYTGAHRRVAVLGQEQINGVTGFHFDVDPATLGKKFVLEVTGGQNAVDLDITFYTEFGSLEQATDTAFAPYNVGFEERKPGGEAGKVPPAGEGVTMTKAIVCMFNGVDATFTYTAGKGVKLPKS